MHRVWLHVYAYNQRAIRAYEKAGFVREGRPARRSLPQRGDFLILS
jgi:RimJ/RimL family protein N-acetyltransferase